MLNKFKFEKHLSNTPIFFQKFVLNNYLLINKNDIDFVRYKKTIDSFKKNKCIFIHIPKTAGISLSKSLFGEDNDTNHLSLRRYRLIFNESDFFQYYKFTIVRNPWDKLFSCYRFLNRGGTTPFHKLWRENVLLNFDNFNDFVKKWVNKHNIYSFSHFLPQHWFLSLNTFEPQIDFIGKFENLEDDFLKIKNKLDIDFNLMHLNQSDKIKKNYFDFYNQESIDIVSEVYKEDINLFNYDFK